MACRTLVQDNSLETSPLAMVDGVISSGTWRLSDAVAVAGLDQAPSLAAPATDSSHLEGRAQHNALDGSGRGDLFVRDAPITVSNGGVGEGPRLDTEVRDLSGTGDVIRFSSGASELIGASLVPVRPGGMTSAAGGPAQAPNTSPASLSSGISEAPLSAIDWGTRIPGQVIDVYFAPAQTYIDGYTGDGTAMGWNDYQKSQIMGALAQISSFTNLTFNVTTAQTGAELRLGTFDFSDDGILGFGVPPGVDYAGYIGFDYSFMRWYDLDSGQSMLRPGGFSYAVMLEEIGHALGLAHMHDDGGTSTILSGVTSEIGSYGVGDLCQGLYSVMNYNEGWPAGPYGSEYLTSDADGYTVWINDVGYEATMMAIDVAVLQRKYGANANHAEGDSTYILPDLNWTGAGFQCIWDTGGIDTIRYDGAKVAQIDLRPASLQGTAGGGGYISYAAPVRGGFTISNGVVIENAIGGSNSDVLTGNDQGNALIGNDGNDTLSGLGGRDMLTGGNGNDLLDGGAGLDSAVFNGAAAARVNLASTAAQATGYGLDRLVSIENVTSGSGNDVLTGTAAANRLTAGSGNDSVVGAGGNDTLEGQTGNDTLDGGRGDDLLNGGDGADMIDGGIGNDVMLGGGGIDCAIFVGSTAVIVNLSVTVAQDTGYGMDRLQDVECVTSGTGNDSLTGSVQANALNAGEGNDVLFGERGNDTLRGNTGKDILVGGGGSDLLIGGAGADLFVFKAALGATNVDTVMDFDVSADVIQLGAAVFPGLARGVLASSAFVANTCGLAQDAQDRIVYDTDDGLLFFDADGSGSGGQVLFANLAAGLALTGADFFVV